MKGDTARNLLTWAALSGILLLSTFALLPSIPTVAQTTDSDSGYVINLNLLPSRVELGNVTHSTGYVGLFSSAEAPLPVAAPRDLEIELSSSNSTVASVPTQIVIPAGKQYAQFDIALGNVEGDTEISALFGNQIINKNFIVSEARSQIPSGVELVINVPSESMQIGSEMPISIYLEHEGGVVQAAHDITISLDYQRDLVSLSSTKVTITKGSYYALVNVRSLEKSGFAFIEASTVEAPSLSTVAVIEIAMTQPATLQTYVFPETIGPSEKTIDVFVALLDVAGNPTIAPEDIELDLFSNSLGVVGIRDANAVIKKGEYGYYQRQSVSFFPREPDVGDPETGIVNVLIGASAEGLGSSSAEFTVMPEDLDAGNIKASEKAIRVFTIETMPSDVNAIVVYQIVAVAQDFRDADVDGSGEINVEDNTAAEEEGTISDRDMNRDGIVDEKDFHAIDNLGDGELYPIKSNVLYATNQGNLDIVTSNIGALRIVDSGSIGSSSSYGTAIISSERLGANLDVSVSIQGLGAETGPVTVVGGLNPTQTSILSPLSIVQEGNYGISFNGDGYSDLFILSLDAQGRPARSPNGLSFLVEPINEIAEIEPGKSFTIARVDTSLFEGALNENSVVSLTPIGVNADANLGTESSFYLVPSTGIVAKVAFPFASIIGASTSHDIGLVQLVDSTGNQVLASNDLAVELFSSDPEVLQVPSEVIIPQEKSFVQFPVTTFSQSGNVSVSAFAEGVGSSTTELSSVLAELEGSFLATVLTATIPQNITISTPFEGTNVLWGPPATFEILAKDDKALIYDPQTNSYLANIQVIADKDGTYTISATLRKDGFQTTRISEGIMFTQYLTPIRVSIDYQQSTISYNKPTTITISVTDKDSQPVENAMIQVTPGRNATAVPTSFNTDANGIGTFVYTASGPNPKVSLELTASKDGYIDGLASTEFEVTDVPTALPPWAIYAAIAGVIASIGGGVVYFMKKPKGKRFDEETEEEDEEI